jgi:hypothetical protein
MHVIEHGRHDPSIVMANIRIWFKHPDKSKTIKHSHERPSSVFGSP